MREYGPDKIHNIDDNTSELKPEPLTPEQLAELESRRAFLATIAKFIGKDFDIPVKLSEPGAGWYWDYQQDEIFADPI